MPEIGILQGRVLPPDLKRFQVFPVDQWREEASRIAAMGFDYLEWLCDRDGGWEQIVSGAAYVPWRQTAGRIAVQSVCCDFLSSACAITQPRDFCAGVRRVLAAFSGSEVRALILPFFHRNHVSQRKELTQILRMCVDEGLVDAARFNGCVLALELDLPAGELREAFAVIEPNGIGLCYDLGNARARGFQPHEEILLLSELIASVHIKDRPVGGPNVFLGEGDVDFPACLAALHEIGYNGMMTLETCYRQDAPAEARRHLDYIRRCLEGLA